MENDELTRRDFVSMTVAAGLAAAACAELSAQQVTETNVEIKTPDGTCDCAFIHPVSGAHPAVIIWPDAFGLRTSMRDMAKRLAMAGYTVLVPNPFYRVGKAPVLGDDASKINFQEIRPKLTPLMQSIQADGAVEKDAPAFIAWLDMQKQVDPKKKIGTQGYCMGGALVMRTAGRYRIAWAQAPRSTAARSSRRIQTARICSRQRSRPTCISASRPTTT